MNSLNKMRTESKIRAVNGLVREHVENPLADITHEYERVALFNAIEEAEEYCMQFNVEFELDSDLHAKLLKLEDGYQRELKEKQEREKKREAEGAERERAGQFLLGIDRIIYDANSRLFDTLRDELYEDKPKWRLDMIHAIIEDAIKSCNDIGKDFIVEPSIKDQIDAFEQCLTAAAERWDEWIDDEISREIFDGNKPGAEFCLDNEYESIDDPSTDNQCSQLMGLCGYPKIHWQVNKQQRAYQIDIYMPKQYSKVNEGVKSCFWLRPFTKEIDDYHTQRILLDSLAELAKSDYETLFREEPDSFSDVNVVFDISGYSDDLGRKIDVSHGTFGYFGDTYGFGHACIRFTKAENEPADLRTLEEEVANQMVEYENNISMSTFEPVCNFGEVLCGLLKTVDCSQQPDTLDFDSMDGVAFESFCAMLLEGNGFNGVEVTQASGDQGIDVLAYKDGVKYGIQCKCYSSDIGNKAVQEAFAGKTFYECHVAAVLTNRFFTSSAIELARRNGVVLWDRDDLQRLIENASGL